MFPAAVKKQRTWGRFLFMVRQGKGLQGIQELIVLCEKTRILRISIH